MLHCAFHESSTESSSPAWYLESLITMNPRLEPLLESSYIPYTRVGEMTLYENRQPRVIFATFQSCIMDDLGISDSTA